MQLTPAAFSTDVFLTLDGYARNFSSVRSIRSASAKILLAVGLEHGSMTMMSLRVR